MQTQPKVPQCWGYEPISGVLDLDLDNPQSINEIILMVKGKMATYSLGGSSLQFLTSERILWHKSQGDPCQVRQAESSSSKEKFNGKLIGKCSFPFSFPFPTKIDPLDNKSDNLSNTTTISPFPSDTPHIHHIAADTSQTGSTKVAQEDKIKKKRASFNPFSSISGPKYNNSLPTNSPEITSSHFPHGTESSGVGIPAWPSIPQSFFEKEVNASVTYELSNRIVHGIFKPTTKIKTNISYLPASQPLPASQKRKEAYEAGIRIPGPFSDPDGWFPSPVATVNETFNCDGRPRQIRVGCTLYVAQPLSYTRGTIIPCFVTLSSKDADALQWFSTPKVNLMRRLRHPASLVEDAYNERKQMGLDTSASGLSRSTSVFNPSKTTLEHTKTVLHEIGRAVWWQLDGPIQSHTKHFEGEIHLSGDLEPTCASKILTVEYYVELLCPRSAHFEPNSDRPILVRERSRQLREGIAVIPVEITTLFRSDEPVPIPVTRPTKIHVRRVSLDDMIPEQDEV